MGAIAHAAAGHALPSTLFSTRSRLRASAGALVAFVGTLAVAWHMYGATAPILCASLLLITATVWLARVPGEDAAVHGEPVRRTTADSIRPAELRAQERSESTTTLDGSRAIATRDPNGQRATGNDPFGCSQATRRALSTRAAHSTGRHEASYVVAAPCFVGVREAIATALGSVWPQPDLALLAPSGHLVHRHDGEIDATIPALARPLAPGDSVTVRLDADAGRVLFVVNGDPVGPSMPVAVGGAYAFVATDPATASTVSMIADRR
ncbi:SPRY incomplete domain containing protein [Pandoravirus salinus]|uniref:SPRY incomplete domain containing protein n=1 Tax=Pandoravirus salinus TaxID=1349410 RepID=A0A291ATJ3_9VIRU|nr:SPRY incomplete domain [Pandoravirus salinus]ATE82212.1 SPRY incomplete domain containing protein [Pandoravirus salinus]